MSLLAELNTILGGLGLSVETGIFSGVPPDEYAVLTPMTDDFALFADNLPQTETQEVRLSFFSKGNYIKRKNQITSALLAAELTITDRRYIGHENDTGYHGYSIDVAKNYELED